MKYLWLLLLVTVLLNGWYLLQPGQEASSTFSYSAEEFGFEEVPIEETLGANNRYTLSKLENWQRPQRPLKVGIQAGHWRNDEVPEELEGLKKKRW